MRFQSMRARLGKASRNRLGARDGVGAAVRMRAMAERPIPQRIPPLMWRAPAFVWTPLALALATGWPAGLFYQEPTLQRVALIAGAIVFALALVTLGVSWATGKAPRTRRVVVLHVVLAGAFTALTAPFALTGLISAAVGEGVTLTPGMAFALTPLALLLGLPVTLISAMLFAWIALKRPPLEEDLVGFDVQPFR
jgi:multisubunit Na+/H+ antiporter MnhG subunit